ncbi:T9SS type A sorting domain-containing protein [bacterium SCSIO 12741]|nr:T9SS type A sorting domain-containing protein [bacterium SCSIO 12741]
MKTVTLLFISLFITTQIFAQNWERLDSLTPYHLNDVFFTSDQNGMAVGENGRILTTTDQGATWTVQNKIPGCNLLSVHFMDSDTGWISGSCGIHKTTDGGATWNLQLAANGTTYNDIHFYDGQHGGASGTLMQIATTHDGGQNWNHSTLSVPESNNPLMAVHFANADTAWVGGGTKLHRTSDGGQTWALNQTFNTVDWILSMDFDPTGRVGIAVGGAGLTLYTYDHSANWNVGGFITPNHQDVNGTELLGTDSIFAVCDDGLIYFSQTGGSAWNSMVSPTENNLNGVHFPSARVGFAVGNNGTMLRYGGINSISPTPKLQVNFKVYPNPSTGNITVSWSGSQSAPNRVELVDALGKVWHSEKLSEASHEGTHHLDLSHLASGVYFIDLTFEEGHVQERLLISPR